MSSNENAPFGYAELRPYAIPGDLDELQGPTHGMIVLPHELAWSGRREFDLNDTHDLAALYKIVLEEGGQQDLRRFLNKELLRRHWSRLRPARQVRARWELRFPSLRHAA